MLSQGPGFRASWGDIDQVASRELLDEAFTPLKARSNGAHRGLGRLAIMRVAECRELLAPFTAPTSPLLPRADIPRGALAGNCIYESLWRRVVCLQCILEHERVCGAELEHAVFEEHLASAGHC